MLLFIAAVAIAFGACQGTQASDKAEIINGISQNQLRFSKLPQVTLSYTMQHRLLSGVRVFAFDQVNVVNARAGACLRTDIKAYGTDGTLLIDRRQTWNGEYGMATLEANSDVYITRRADNLMFYYNYYLTFLGYPGGVDSAARPDGAPDDYCVPGVFKVHYDEYEVEASLEAIDGENCYRLQRRGVDRFWVSARDLTVRKRELYWGETNLLERTSFQDFRSVGDTVLPFLVVRTEYGRPEESERLRNVVCCEKIIRLSSVSTAPVNAGEFELSLPPGIVVHDRVKGISYVVQDPSQDRLQSTLDLAREHLALDGAGRGWGMVRIYVNLAVLLVLSLFAAIRWRANVSVRGEVPR